MGKDRLAAFSDGVIAIIITIMVLELKVPHGADWAALRALAPNLLSYVLSFVYRGDLLEQPSPSAAYRDAGERAILWANTHLLFWLSLTRSPPAGWARTSQPPADRDLWRILLMPAIAYYLLQKAIVHQQGRHSVLASALGSDFKGKFSVLLDAAAVALAFVDAWLSIADHVLVAVMWLIPDRRIEKALREG